MQIEFPCPIVPKDMTKNEDGYHCSHCSKTLVDVSNYSINDIQELKKEDPYVCVITDKNYDGESQFSIRKFALALLLVFGSGMFVFGEAQDLKKIERIQKDFSVDKYDSVERVIGVLSVKVEDQKGRRLNASVLTTLPNGKEIELKEVEQGLYILEVPEWCKDKEITVVVDYFGKIKYRSLLVSQLLDPHEEFFVFRKTKKDGTTVFGTVGCPSF